ncbi:MAG: S-methyl-5'-thioadenosine phosphorylase [Victivallaceae bacterium]|nr:S-methyl-5'-thioadenosine phosphorylase [Victivallaceae bacterium]MDD4180562.1 S-methyl-5'-thioadenosine phosphorylase [Victivallaceae bacterium]
MMKLGIIGGSGLYDIDGVENIEKVNITTPFGEPSDSFTCGTLNGQKMVFLSRHGRGHVIAPAEINHRANIFAMKTLGVTHIISISAVGSLRERIRPRDIVLVDQYYDRRRTAGQDTFFGNGIVAHIGFGNPVCPELSAFAAKAAKESIENSDDTERRVHITGTYVNMEGPAFSTKIESKIYRDHGFHVIGMTNLPEAKLAREAEIAYATIAMVTDYDCWHPDHDHVTVDMVIGHLIANTEISKDIIKRIAKDLKNLSKDNPCFYALENNIITARESITAEVKKRLEPIIGKYCK